LLVRAGLMLVCGALGDRYGRKRLFMIGLGLFGGASALATWADTTALGSPPARRWKSAPRSSWRSPSPWWRCCSEQTNCQLLGSRGSARLPGR
jgi:MFS family permease